MTQLTKLFGYWSKGTLLFRYLCF